MWDTSKGVIAKIAVLTITNFLKVKIQILNLRNGQKTAHSDIDRLFEDQIFICLNMSETVWTSGKNVWKTFVDFSFLIPNGIIAKIASVTLTYVLNIQILIFLYIWNGKSFRENVVETIVDFDICHRKLLPFQIYKKSKFVYSKSEIALHVSLIFFAAFFSKVQMNTKLLLKICLHLNSTRGN